MLHKIKKDLPEGNGTYQYKNGDLYVGDWKKGKRHGKGFYAHSVGEWETDLYVGDFVEDMKNGEGIYTFTDGVRYIGEFKDDKKEGKGRYIYLDGSTKQIECLADLCKEI